MEIHTNELTEAYFANESNWLGAMKTVKETLGMKIVCEFNQNHQNPTYQEVQT